MQNPGTLLCSACQAVELASYFQEERHAKRQPSGFIRPARDATLLCSLANLHAKSGAYALCALVMEALLRRWGPDNMFTASDYVEWAKTAPGLEADPQIYLYSYRFAEDGYGGAKTSPPNNSRSETARPVFRLGIALRRMAGKNVPNVPFLDHTGDIQVRSTSSLIREPGTTFHGRILDPYRANIQLAREWIDECKQGHGDLCERASRGDDVVPVGLAPRNLRVINVNSMCLVWLPAEAKYVALSYCWA